jgi:hypothetical protein
MNFKGIPVVMTNEELAASGGAPFTEIPIPPRFSAACTGEWEFTLEATPLGVQIVYTKGDITYKKTLAWDSIDWPNNVTDDILS